MLSTLGRSVDTFTVPLHSLNSRHLPAIRAVQRDCQWGLKNGWNSHRSRYPIMQWDTRQSQATFRLTNHTILMAASWGHVFYPTDCPIATRVQLCSSLTPFSYGIHRQRCLDVIRHFHQKCLATTKYSLREEKWWCIEFWKLQIHNCYTILLSKIVVQWWSRNEVENFH